MEKRHLVITALACGLAAIFMVGAVNAPQEAYTNPSNVYQEDAVDQEAEVASEEEPESVSALAMLANNAQAACVQAAVEQAVSEEAAASAASSKASNADSNASKSTSSSEKSNTNVATKDSVSSSLSAQSSGRTITVDGVTMSYTDSYGASSAPSSGAGVWKGSDSTTDGSYAYFIGHNPGSFGAAATASNGSKVTVNDSNGDSRTYTVVDSFVVPEGSSWSDVSDRVTGYGESVVLQTCVSEGYRILIAG